MTFMQNKTITLTLTSFFLFLLMASSNPALAEENYPTATDKQLDNDLGYALGWEIGKIIKINNPFINFEKVVSGISDSTSGKPSMLSEDQINTLTKELADQNKISTNINNKQHDKELGYALGWRLGKVVTTNHPTISSEKVTTGIDDSLHGKSPQLSAEKINTLTKELANKTQASLEDQQKIATQARVAQSVQNNEAGRAFLSKNKLSTEITTTPSGLQYKVLREGNGLRPKEKDYVTIDYKGMFIDEKEFDSSYKRGRAHNCFVDQAIPGWTEILQLMNVGSKYRIYLPPELAFGDEGYGPIVPPKTTLIYEIELLSIDPPQTQKGERPTNKIFSQIDLRDIEKAAGSFMRLYTGISPDYKKEDLVEICQTISEEAFKQSCTEILSKKLSRIQGIDIQKATFQEKKIDAKDIDHNTVLVSWREQLTMANNQTITTKESMIIQFTKNNSLWKINKITPAAANPSAIH